MIAISKGISFKRGSQADTHESAMLGNPALAHQKCFAEVTSTAQSGGFLSAWYPAPAQSTVLGYPALAHQKC